MMCAELTLTGLAAAQAQGAHLHLGEVVATKHSLHVPLHARIPADLRRIRWRLCRRHPGQTGTAGGGLSNGAGAVSTSGYYLNQRLLSQAIWPS